MTHAKNYQQRYIDASWKEVDLPMPVCIGFDSILQHPSVHAMRGNVQPQARCLSATVASRAEPPKYQSTKESMDNNSAEDRSPADIWDDKRREKYYD